MRRTQRGATLLVGLIMLLLLTLQALAAFHSGAIQLRIAGNMQDRHAAEAAANQAIGQALAAGDFATRAAEVAAQPVPIDADGDGVADHAVALVPVCTATKPLAAASIDADDEADAGCIAGAAFGAAPLCAITQWDLQATATPAAAAAQTGARSEIHQGVSVRMAASEAVDAC
jgi:hypothetical protein